MDDGNLRPVRGSRRECAPIASAIFSTGDRTRSSVPRNAAQPPSERHPETESVTMLKLENDQLRAEVDRLRDKFFVGGVGTRKSELGA
jgi:hypothetical protein